ncbi:uncharacterized protein J4E84_007896 [Alternaria hordeiaustralica]|uniref:uncharacterized protein n=1 Tax=Alternaria hordeiaustralica TaxID=1187925 RepID=UPI0020C58414|nr:uncharacterized protein J4E84_007896 [Alternaria hordeiaustralica]KAI4680756.1 hypothetical protein J4E84_007896 [Alternaria hordeiaustralica]
METARTRTPSISRSVAPKFSPLNQHPVSSTAESDKAHPIFLEHPFERLSPTLAAYPRVVEALQKRRISVYPDVSETMQKALGHRADFFDDFSSESEWEDRMSKTIQSPITSEGPGLRDIPYDIHADGENAQRGRNRQRSTITSLPRLADLADVSGSGTDDSGTGDERASGRGTNHARKMSLTRLNKDNVRLVDNRSIRSSIDSPRHSLRSNLSLPNSPLMASVNSAPFSTSGPLEDTLTALPQSPTFRREHRRTASSNSTSDSVLADSIINAHVMTMRALEALSSEPRSIDPRVSSDMANAAGRTYLHSASSTSWPKSTSFSANRHVTLSPLSTGDENQDDRASRHRTAQIYSPAAIKSPNPFSVPNTATTNTGHDLLIPKPSYIPQKHASTILDSHLSALNFSLSNRTTEDYTRLNSCCTSAFPFADEPKSPYDDRKGKEVLGLMTGNANGEECDMRSRRERNESAQGVVRGSAEERGRGGGGERGGVSVEEGGVVVLVGLRRWTWGMGRGRCACACGNVDEEQAGLSLPGREEKFARIVIPTYASSSWTPKHSYTKSSMSNCNSENRMDHSGKMMKKERSADFDDEAFAVALRAANRELAGNWFRRTFSARTLSGIHVERRSTWDHGNGDGNNKDDRDIHPALRSPQNSQPTTPSSDDLLALYKNPQIGRKNYTWISWARRNTSSPSPSPPTLHLTYTLSRPRILLVMGILLLISLLAAAAWILVGAGEGKLTRKEFSQRVGSGMAIAGFVLAVEAWVCGAWVAFS